MTIATAVSACIAYGNFTAVTVRATTLDALLAFGRQKQSKSATQGKTVLRNDVAVKLVDVQRFEL